MEDIIMPQVVAITGGAQGIGRAMALLFAKEGYLVSIADVHKEAGFEIIRMIRRQGGQAMFVAVDTANEADVRKWLELTREDLGDVDVLINNAGIGIGGSMLELSLEDFDRVISVNLRGTFLCSKYAARIMKENGKGCIINMCSTRALMSEADTEAYSASKGGIFSLTHAMAVSLGKYGIRVNSISPGWIETRDWQLSSSSTLPHHSDKDRLQHPVGRVGKPEDIAQACLYLMSDKAGFITGQNIVIDGGMTIKMIYE
jgi:NAD(P)-dependent dehydrogenase (short-subunit alcohol dehydrogenase family)